MSGLQTRSPHRRIPVWGFPKGYDPNPMGDVCEICRRTNNWQRRVVPEQPFDAWSCRCTTGAVAIPD